MTLSKEPAYRIDDRRVDRKDFYAAACDPARSVVVEACAGAGKTWMLVSRILRALLAGVAPRQILAITFTKKAAAEMRHRLMQWLGEMASDVMDDAARVQALLDRGLSLDQARAQAPSLRGLYERLLASGEAVEIRTFHAWFSQLMRAAPLQVLESLGLPSQAALIEDIEELKPVTWRQFLSSVLVDAGLRDDFERLVCQRGRRAAEQWLMCVLDKRIEFELADLHGAMEASVPEAAAVFASLRGLTPLEVFRSDAFTSKLWRVAKAVGSGGGKLRQDVADRIAHGLAVADDAAAFEAVWRALFTHNGTPRTRLGDSPELLTLQDELLELHEAIEQQAAHEEHQRLTRLARVLLQEYAAVKRARGLADMADLERCALALLRDSELSGWLQERLDARISQVLIDEFQDTNPIQWQALQSWLSGYAGAGGGASGQRPPSVFIVGDPKQSIYRFRRAEPRVFEAAKRLVVEGLGGAVLACDHTRRNTPAVLEAVNAVFEAAQHEGRYEGFRAHTTEVGERDGSGAVLGIEQVQRASKEEAGEKTPRPEWRDSLACPRHEPEEILRLEEARRVAAAIASLVEVEGFDPGDIYVLSRRRAQLRMLALALRERHLPFATPEESVLMEALEVRDVVALLDALVSPAHDLALAHALRSPIFGASDEDLVTLALAARTRGTWSQALRDMPPPELSPALLRARKLLAAWTELAGRLPPHDLLDRIVFEGGLRERYAAAVPAELRHSALAHLDALLALALQLDGGRYATPYKFVRALRRRALSVPARTESRAIQLLTIHGAKGLEARVVFVMDADTESRSSTERSESSTVLIDWPAEDPGPRCFAFIASESRVPASLRLDMERERQARAREEMNGLYVAMTRAREQLVFSSTEPHRRPADPTWWQRVNAHGIAAVRPETALPPLEQGAPQPGKMVGIVLKELPRLERPAPPVRLAPSAADDPAAARIGEAVHRTLEWLTAQDVSLDRIDAAVSAAAAAHALDGVGHQLAERTVRAIVESPGFKPFLPGAEVRWAGNEVALTWRGQVLRIDRLVQRQGKEGPEWWVLDYKLGHSPQALATYREQLARYREAVQAGEPHARVRAAFVTGQGELIELE